MNGAQALIRSLVNLGVDTCFMNPGTSEMHFVAELDSVPEIKPILTLYEGVASGAADGYARIKGSPAAVLLHLGPGLGNAFANYHNAKRAKSPIINIVGEHATYHKRYDAPLESDIVSLANPISKWVRTALNAQNIAGDTLDAYKASMAPPCGIASLILPADISWSEGASPIQLHSKPISAASLPSETKIHNAIKALRSEKKCTILLGGKALCAQSIKLASQIATHTNSKLLAETFPARIERGGSIPELERVSYLGEFAQSQLEGSAYLLLFNSKAPVSFFAYPGKPSYLAPLDCEVIEVASDSEDAHKALSIINEELHIHKGQFKAFNSQQAPPEGELTPQKLAQIIGISLKEGTIVSDESNTLGLYLAQGTKEAEEHIWMCLTGGAIGQGLPLATGAAVANKDAKVLALEADGSSMYSIQALWTQARENLNVTNIILDNQAYGVLEMELSRVGAKASGQKAHAMLDLSTPSIDFVSIAKSFGLQARTVTNCEEFLQTLKEFEKDGPNLIHVPLGKGLVL